jgi:hypothetical protein
MKQPQMVNWPKDLNSVSGLLLYAQLWVRAMIN